MVRNILPIILAGHLVFALGCFNSPTQFQSTYGLDCSKVTMPKTKPSDTTKIFGFVEIYDFNKRLVAYSQDSNGTGLYYIWDGKDMNGNPVGPGKYVTKISVIDYVRGQNQCLCSDVYVAP